MILVTVMAVSIGVHSHPLILRLLADFVGIDHCHYRFLIVGCFLETSFEEVRMWDIVGKIPKVNLAVDLLTG